MLPWRALDTVPSNDSPPSTPPLNSGPAEAAVD